MGDDYSTQLTVLFCELNEPIYATHRKGSVNGSLYYYREDSPSWVLGGQGRDRWILTAVETELQSNRDELLWGIGIGSGST